jgi:hypothetical protein
MTCCCASINFIIIMVSMSNDEIDSLARDLVDKVVDRYNKLKQANPKQGINELLTLADKDCNDAFSEYLFKLNFNPEFISRYIDFLTSAFLKITKDSNE